MCLDHSKGILEWKGDEFNVIKKIWLNQVDMLWNQAKLGSGLSQNNLILED